MNHAAPPSWILFLFYADFGDFAHISPNGVNVYFYMVVSAAYANSTGSLVAPYVGLWLNNGILPASVRNATSTSGSVGAYFTYPSPPSASQPLVTTVRVGVSTVSIAGAANNLYAEQQVGGQWLTFNQSVANARAAWMGYIGRVTVNDATGGGFSVPTPPQQFPQQQRGRATLKAGPWAHLIPDAETGNPGGVPDLDVAAAYVSSLFNASELERVGKLAGLRGESASNAAAVAAALLRQLMAHNSAKSVAARTVQDDLTVFYTSLYHTYAAPTTYSDADGTYLGFDWQLHNSGAYPFYSDLSDWDVFRTTMPWMSLTTPEFAAGITSSLLIGVEQDGGQLPRWPFANINTGIMVR